jgi:hypothetical protein
MKYLVISVALLAFAVTAFAGGNPNVKGYLSFDADGALIHEYMMTQYVGFNVYVCLTDLDLGMDVVSFMLTDAMVDCPGLFGSASFTNLLPGDLAIGAWNTGITIASTECMATNPVVVGYLNLFPIAIGGCCMRLLDHPEYPCWVVDCALPNGDVDYYTLIEFGQADINEGCDSPVEDATWGAIKALYQ